jgi:hypothetical protein
VKIKQRNVVNHRTVRVSRRYLLSEYRFSHLFHIVTFIFFVNIDKILLSSNTPRTISIGRSSSDKENNSSVLSTSHRQPKSTNRTSIHSKKSSTIGRVTKKKSVANVRRSRLSTRTTLAKKQEESTSNKVDYRL